MTEERKQIIESVIKLSRLLIFMTLIAVAGIIILMVLLFNNKWTGPSPENTEGNVKAIKQMPEFPISVPTTSSSADLSKPIWKAPDISLIPAGKSGEMIRYGRDLVVHTSDYFGPKGNILRISNGMNCQNCHLDGGTRIFGNNFAGFIAGYPKMSGRSGKVEPATERIAECFQRSLSGKVPDTSGKEIQAILAYMKWLGRGVKKGQQLYGNATEKLPFMDIAADPVKGKAIFIIKCQSCHGKNGEGVMAADKKSFTYPPLWGNHSYNDGAGMYRVTNLAGFVKNNMPYGATYQNPQLTNEEAWNIAAFINSQPRPHKDQRKDWTDLDKKPIDFPFGPYADRFSEKQHKYGPFKPIKNAQRSRTTN
jgi:thiosulfate dehydrogenase